MKKERKKNTPEGIGTSEIYKYRKKETTLTWIIEREEKIFVVLPVEF